MPTPRSWKRESRLLLIVAELSQEQHASTTDVFTVDFLMQHPSLFRSFARRGARPLPALAEPSESETESSEEGLLRWKRSVGNQVLMPMLGRLVSRGLIAQSGDGRLAIRPRGLQAAKQLEGMLGRSEQSRLGVVAERVLTNERRAREWLRAALAEE